MKLTLIIAAAIMVLTVMCATPTAAQRPMPEATPTAVTRQVEAWMRQAGYDYHMVKANSWFIIMPGKQLPTVRILLGVGGESIAVGAVAARHETFRPTSDMLLKMMKLSYDLNYVRVCIDTDGDLLALSQVKSPWLDINEFKATVTRVADAADRAYVEAKPFLIEK